MPGLADWLESVAFSVAAVAAMVALGKVVDWMEGRKTPEQRKEEERWEWKHGRR